VPENTHWDPAYTADEARFVLQFDPDNRAGLQDPEIEALRESLPEEVELEYDDIAIPDHAELGEDSEPEDEGCGPLAGRRSGGSLDGVLTSPDAAVALASLAFVGTYLFVRAVSRQHESA